MEGRLRGVVLYIGFCVEEKSSWFLNSVELSVWLVCLSLTSHQDISTYSSPLNDNSKHYPSCPIARSSIYLTSVLAQVGGLILHICNNDAQPHLYIYPPYSLASII